MSSEPIHVEKVVWTAADFETMGWHDAALHAIAIQPAQPWPGRLLLDIDYILKWVAPTHPNTAFAFWLCPATLVFDEARDLVADIDLAGWTFQLSLNGIERSDADGHGFRTWTIDGHEFTMRLSSRGFTQYLRRPPVLCESQWISAEDRGGLSFAEQAFE